MTKSQTEATKLTATLRARNPLIVIVTREEHRVEPWLMNAAAAAGYTPRTWDVAAGLRELDGKPLFAPPPGYATEEPDPRQIASRDPGSALSTITSAAEDKTATPESPKRYAWICRDMMPWLMGQGGAATCRQLRNLCRMFPDRQRAQPVIILTPSNDLPPELSGHATIIQWPLPDRDEIASILDMAIGNLPAEMQEGAALNGTREKAIDAAVGLAGYEAENCYASSLVTLKGRIDPALVNAEKKRIIAATKVLQVMDAPEGGLDAIGGLGGLKQWLMVRTAAYSPEARAYGLQTLRALMVIGVSGCGKTLLGTAVSVALGNLPLFRLDINAAKGKYVGQSEENIRRAYDTIDNAGPCVVIVDEIEKAMAGATQGAADGGVSADALGSFLTWMQERKSQALIIATANDVSSLPPEMLRKGRWDELFFVDLPTLTERAEVILAALSKRGRRDALTLEDRLTVARATEGFTGAELDSLVPDALFPAFADNRREVNAQDLINAARMITPLSVTAKEKVDALRKWSKGRARPATTPETQQETATASTGRALDI